MLGFEDYTSQPKIKGHLISINTGIADEKHPPLPLKSHFSSGRDDIYIYVLDAVAEHPFLGNYIGYLHWKTSYAHNVFLEVMGNYGIPIFVIFFIFLLYVFYDVLKNSTYFNKQYFLVLASCFIARGMLSEGHFFDNFLMLIFGLYLSGKFTEEF